MAIALPVQESSYDMLELNDLKTPPISPLTDTWAPLAEQSGCVHGYTKHGHIQSP